MFGSNVCWQNAYKNLFAGCSEILATNDKRSRLAWHLSDCFQRDSGRPYFPHCDSKTPISKCLRNLDDLAHKVYLEFYLETNSICYQLQLSEVFFFFQFLILFNNSIFLKSDSLMFLPQLELSLYICTGHMHLNMKLRDL